MPVDKSGNRADIVMCPASTVKRSNLARLIAPELGASARETSTKLRQMLGYNDGVDPYEYVKSVNEEVFRVAYDYLLGFYNITSETQYTEACEHNLQDRQELMGDILKDGIYMCMPIDNPKNITDTIVALKQQYPYTYDTVSYIGLDGKPTESKDKVLIGPIYTMILDKIADTWSAVSTGKLQHFGVLSPRTKADKTTLPFRETPVRTIGATEGRIFAAYAGREALAEQMDRSNSPRTQRNIAYNILAAANPGNIDEVVDREYIPYGNTRPIQLVSHIISAAGGRITYQSEHVTPKQEFFEPAYTNIQNKKKP